MSETPLPPGSESLPEVLRRGQLDGCALHVKLWGERYSLVFPPTCWGLDRTTGDVWGYPESDPRRRSLQRSQWVLPLSSVVYYRLVWPEPPS